MSATATNIGPKISVEGEAEYRRQMNQIIAQQKALVAELKATTSGFAADATAQEKARASGAVLQKEISNLSQALKEQQGMLDKAVAKYGENSKQALSYKAAVYNTTAQINDLKKELDSAGNALDDTADAMDNAGQSSIKFGDLIKANVIADFVVDGIKQVASAAKDLASSFVQAAADVRAEKAQFSQTFGDLAGEATTAIQNVATTANTLPTLLQPAATSIYAFARSSGATTAEAMDLMSQSMQVAVDSAAYYDRTLSETTETLQSFLKGNYENDAALGVSATETTRNAEAMKLFGKEFNDLSEIQKQQTLLQMVVDAQELSGAMGQAAREADSWANVQGNLDEAWRQFSATQGQAMLDALIPVIQEVTNLLVGLTDGSLTAGEALQQAFDFISEQVAGIAAQLPSVLQNVLTSLGSVAAQLVSEIPDRLSTLGNIGGSIVSALSAVLPEIQAAAAGLVASLKQGIEANFPQLLDSGLKALTSFTAGLRENIGQIVDQGLSLVLSLAQGIADGMPSLIEQVPQIVSNIAGIINDNAPKILAAGVQIIATLAAGIVKSIPTIVQNLPQIINAIVDVITAFNWLNLGKTIINTLGQGITAMSGAVTGFMKSSLKGALDYLKSLPSQAVQWGSQMIAGFIKGLVGNVGSVIKTVSEFAASVVGTIKSAWDIHSPSGVAEWISGNWMKGLDIGFKNNAGQVMKTVDDIAQELETRFSAIQDTLSAQQSIEQQSFDNWLSTDGQDASSAEVAARQIESLTQQLSAQQSVLQAAEQAYTKIVELYGAGSAEALKYQKTLLEQTGTFEDLQNQIDQVKLDEITAGYDDLKESMDAATSRAKLDFDIWQSEYADTATESEKLQKQLEYQNAELENQAQVVEEAKATYQQLCDTYGATSDEAQSYIETLDKEITTYADLKDGVKETTEALEESQDKLQQLADEADSFFDSAKSFTSSISSLGDSISDLFDNLKNNPFSGGSEAGSFFEWAGDVVDNLLDIGSGFASLITTTKDFGAALQGLPAIGNLLGGILGGADGGILGVIGSLGTSLGGIVSTITGAVGSIGTTFAGMAGTAGTSLSSIGAALAGLAGGPVGVAVAAVAALGSAFVVATADGNTLGEKISNVFEGIRTTITNVVSSAFNWGRDMIQGFIDGVSSLAGTLLNGIKGLAKGIASFLHFSRPDQGPLREYEQWMPDMIQGMAKGIRDNTWMLRDAAADTAQLISDRMTVPVNIAAAASGTQPAARNVSFSFGDIVVNGSGTTDVDELADRVIDRLTMQVQQKEAAYGLV